MADPLIDSIALPQKSNIAELDRLAIDAALSCDWIKAEDLNRQLAKEDPKNIACLNRLARALFELGKYQQAKKIYQEVLEIDPYNPIAQKNLKRATAFKKNDVKLSSSFHTNPITISPTSFLEEAGITKVVNLIKVAEPQKLSRLYAGALINLATKSRGISVTDQDNNYLGALPDDVAHLLLKLINGGNKYQALIKSVKPNGLSILIREIYRSKKFKNQPSFIDNAKNFTYSSDNISISYDDSSDNEGDSEETTV